MRNLPVLLLCYYTIIYRTLTGIPVILRKFTGNFLATKVRTELGPIPFSLWRMGSESSASFDLRLFPAAATAFVSLLVYIASGRDELPPRPI